MIHIGILGLMASPQAGPLALALSPPVRYERCKLNNKGLNSAPH